MIRYITPNDAVMEKNVTVLAGGDMLLALLFFVFLVPKWALTDGKSLCK